MRISQLESRRVALWGWGREGRAAYAALRARRESGNGNRESGERSRQAPLPLTLFCGEDEAREAAALGDPHLTVRTQVDADALAAFDVVIKSPGISPYKPEALAAAARGTRFIGGTALWFAEHAGADGVVPRTVCVTGTKGKSTTTALLAHLLRAGGHVTALAGNIGLPLLEVLDPEHEPELWAIELSSYQTGDVADSGARPEVAVVLNLFPEHLDWHGSHERYLADKLRLVTDAKPHIAVLNAADPRLAALVGAPRGRDRALGDPGQAVVGMARSYDGEVRWFGHAQGWHLREDALYRGDAFVMDTASLPLPGRHNRGNLCAVLTAIEALGFDAAPLAPHAATFRPLPNRLQPIGSRDGFAYVNDSISTTPHASLAALDCYRGHRVALLLGGHDRGLPWEEFAVAMQAHAPDAIVTMGANGPRIHALLEPLAAQGRFRLVAAKDLSDAMEQARMLLGRVEGDEGVILLSPGAPSFGAYRDYVERGRHFARLAGFDPDAISVIPGLGIA